MKKLTSTIAICGCLFSAFSMGLANAKGETFFSCKNGFQFETKQQAARCIQQQRLTFQEPHGCNKKMFQLKVDFRGTKDMCVGRANNNLKQEQFIKPITGGPKPRSAAKNVQTISFSPKCSVGFKLQIRKGKDACAKGQPEKIAPPSKKVTR